MVWASSGKQFEEYAIENAGKSLENGEHLNSDFVEVPSDLQFDIPSDQHQNSNNGDNLHHEEHVSSKNPITANEEHITDISHIVEQSQPNQDVVYNMVGSNSESDNSDSNNSEGDNSDGDNAEADSSEGVNSEDDNSEDKTPKINW
ncbi:unnamed protein product [[Candida] boidinii]|nr:unnamed protein product [[Candida] boidinii]